MKVKSLCFFILFLFIFSTSDPTAIKAETDINVLMLLDTPFGPEYFSSREILENRFGWNIKTASLFDTIDPCSLEYYHSIDVDYTLDKLPNIENFDILSIMGGPNQDNLLESQEALQLVKKAVDKGLVVAAWCRAVRVLAAADVIDSKNITGHWDFESEYEDAGANYFELSEPIIDGKLVTCYSSTQYRMEMCIAMATAVGVYEDELPEVSNFQISKESSNNYSILIAAVDNIAPYSCLIEIYNLTENGERLYSYPKISLLILDENHDGNFSSIFYLSAGNYSLDLTIRDIYDNVNFYLDIDQISNIVQTTSQGGVKAYTIILFSFVIFSLLYLKRRKQRK